MIEIAVLLAIQQESIAFALGRRLAVANRLTPQDARPGRRG